jgi:cytoplasmic iron level regulating protein YaaA (DUF328/UPF0246 family)
MPMILLPPSEGKTSPISGDSLCLDDLSYSGLNKSREQVLTALEVVSKGEIEQARKIIGISAKQDFEIQRNREIFSSPCAPAHQIYTGVLFDAIGMDSLNKSQLAKLNRLTNVVSALFGLITLGDLIPTYRLSGDANLPIVGSLAKHWSPQITQELSKVKSMVIDLRSGIYQKLGPIPKEISENSVIPRVMQKMSSGPPKVVSHHNKATKGRIVRAIIEHKAKIESIEDLAELIAKLDADVSVVKPAKGQSARILDVVIAAH